MPGREFDTDPWHQFKSGEIVACGLPCPVEQFKRQMRRGERRVFRSREEFGRIEDKERLIKEETARIRKIFVLPSSLPEEISKEKEFSLKNKASLYELLKKPRISYADLGSFGSEYTPVENSAGRQIPMST